MIPANFGWWLSGLIDGEGCFRISKGRSHGRFPQFHCRFSLKQRDDDTSLLAEIVERTGIGGVRYDTSRPGNSKPCAIWVVESKADTAALVALLDRYPLRSRKRRDYAVWREAVAHRAQEKRGNRWHGQRDWTAMEDFKRRIEEARLYVGRR
jgi:hypothetical protein